MVKVWVDSAEDDDETEEETVLVAA